MRRFGALLASSLLIASTALIAIAGPVAASGRPEPVTISSTMITGGPLNSGTFERTSGGTICDSGDVQDTRWVWGGVTPHGQQLLVDKTFTCPDGEFYVRMQISGVYVAETFRWVILGGTGDYAGLHGQGFGWTDYFEGYVINYYEGFLTG